MSMAKSRATTTFPVNVVKIQQLILRKSRKKFHFQNDYKQQRLSKEDIDAINNFIDNFDYVCGTEIPINTVFINSKNVCNIPLSKLF